MCALSVCGSPPGSELLHESGSFFPGHGSALLIVALFSMHASLVAFVDLWCFLLRIIAQEWFAILWLGECFLFSLFPHFASYHWRFGSNQCFVIATDEYLGFGGTYAALSFLSFLCLCLCLGLLLFLSSSSLLGHSSVSFSYSVCFLALLQQSFLRLG